MAIAQSANEYAAALRYSPQTQQALRRSEYLSEALKAMNESSQTIRSGGELAARLLAVGLLRRGEGKARDATLASLKGDQSAEAARLLKGFEGLSPPPAASAPVPDIAPPPPPAAVQAAPLPAAAPPGRPAITPDTDALVRTVYGEARGEPPEGQQGVAAVVLNRSKERGLPVAGVVHQPGQFEPWNNPKTRQELESLSPDNPQYQQILANISPVLSGQMPAQFAGADHFYSPGAQSALGRPPPKWDNGSGQDVGRHRFFNLEPDRADAPPPPPPPPNPAGPDYQPTPQFQLAARDLQPGMMPSAGGGSPPAPPAGAAPAASSPQAAAGVNYWRPTPAQVQHVQALMADPRTFEEGRTMALQIQQKMTQPVEMDTVSINGMQYYVPKTPGAAPTQAIPVPPEAMTRVRTAQELGVQSAPQGAYLQQDPTGNVKEVYTPPVGFNAAPGGALSPQRGGPQDPYRVQAPAPNYTYTQQGGVAPIPGSAADPRNPMNLVEGTKGLRSEIQPVVQQAIQLKRNVDSVRSGFAQQNGAGDIAMVNGLQRLIDEGVVREGDVALQLKAQGLAGSISGVRGFMNSDGFFTDPKIRNAVLATANSLYQNVNANYRDRVQGYRSIADGTFGDGTFDKFVFPVDVARSLGWVDSPNKPPAPAVAAQPAPTPGTHDAAVAEARRRRLIK